MAPDTSSKPARSGLSLYANLLDPSSKSDGATGTISGTPVLYRQDASGEDSKTSTTDKQQINADLLTNSVLSSVPTAALRFQPKKRPQIQAQKAKAKPFTQKGPQQSSPANAPNDLSSEPSRPPPAKTTLADWTADGDENDVNGFYTSEKRQRGGRKKKRKINKEQAVVEQNWDDIYDPSRPNNYEDYRYSDEKIAEIREWKDRLYAHRMARERRSESRSDSEDAYRPQMSNRFTPSNGLNFAPPPAFDDEPPPLPPDDATGEDAYTRRVQLSQMNVRDIYLAQSPAQSPEKVSNRHTPSTAACVPTISRAPVRYSLPPAPSGLPSSEAELYAALENERTGILDTEHRDRDGGEKEEEEDEEEEAPRSVRPGQKGFAERLMSKYGWSKGSGLGASGTGIVNPLRVQVEKQKKKPDSEGGGFVGPRTGMILGGKRKSAGASEEGKFGAMSDVVILRGMVDGMDLDAEMGNEGGGLMQEIGEECSDKYGRVERVFIDRNASKASVFVKFTSQLSALRAVNALEGRIFNGNTIAARFFDAEKFEHGEYE